MTAPRWQDVPEEAREIVMRIVSGWLADDAEQLERLRTRYRGEPSEIERFERRVCGFAAALARLAEPERSAEPATCDAPDWSRGVVETAERLHGSVTGSGDPIDDGEAAAWLDARTSPEGWQPSSVRHNGGACAAYDEAVRALARAAIAVACESSAWRPASRSGAAERGRAVAGGAGGRAADRAALGRARGGAGAPRQRGRVPRPRRARARGGRGWEVSAAPVDATHLGTLLVCAVRYAMHRQTYIVDDACAMVRAYVHAATRADAEVIRVDIERELRRAREGGFWIGHRDDHRQWEALATWLRERERAHG